MTSRTFVPPPPRSSVVTWMARVRDWAMLAVLYTVILVLLSAMGWCIVGLCLTVAQAFHIVLGVGLGLLMGIPYMGLVGGFLGFVFEDEEHRLSTGKV